MWNCNNNFYNSCSYNLSIVSKILRPCNLHNPVLLTEDIKKSHHYKK